MIVSIITFKKFQRISQNLNKQFSSFFIRKREKKREKERERQYSQNQMSTLRIFVFFQLLLLTKFYFTI